MIKKVFFILIFISVSQILNSCLFFGSCPSPKTFEVIYTDVSIKAENIADYSSIENNGTINKSALGLAVWVNFDATQIAQNMSFTSLGLKSAYALSCEDDIYEFQDDILNIEILITNIGTGAIKNANQIFGQFDYYVNNFITIDEVMENRYEGDDRFSFEILEPDSLPDSAIFTVKVELESGTILADETPVINFFNH